jgi:hypothetical protein
MTVSSPSARDLLEWNDQLPESVCVVEEADYGATPTFMVVVSYGWAESIICGGCYCEGAEAIAQAIREVCGITA